MGLAVKIFDKMGLVTIVTHPSMIMPEKISFTLINLEEKTKNEFATAINKEFPKDNITVYMYNESEHQDWLEKAISRSTYVLMDKDKAPIWVTEMSPEKKTHTVSEQQSVQQVFETISNKMKD